MSKLKLFLILASALLISCANPNDPGDDGTGGGGTGTGGGTGGGGTGNPSWYLTAEQQSKPFFTKEVRIFQTTSGQIYRIPTILVAKNGNIIVFGDTRYSHGSDVGQGDYRVDVLYSLSKDGGKTWSEKKPILPLSRQGQWDSKGDSVGFQCDNGDLVVLCASGGAWFNAPAKPSKVLLSRSTDNGENWSQWEEIQDQFFTGDVATKYNQKFFVASGRQYTMTKDPYKGRLIAAMLIQPKNGGTAALTIYSDDNGINWKAGGVTQNSSKNSDEPKVMTELNDGRLLMSVRPPQPGNRLWAYSSDGGLNFTQLDTNPVLQDGKVDAEGIRYTSTLLGHDKNRLLFINCNANSRKRLAISLSEDENKSWNQAIKVLEEGDSCYSSINVLGDGTVVTFGEEKATSGKGYDLVFRRYNLFDLTGEVYKTEWYK